ncbi:GTP-binding protein [Clostridium cylindrosporum]|uniref:sulfate adenylyltransferase n=1 Tax=Clostridium cylindrosporum DSM 605 TaxID=1121307 RepID=A0A0J8G6V0_CLOCY|nr:GTP-binding protein [Clostridium cylindrosporum]KMT23321.1 bifunctional enzyme NodQ [Clostridium cylindrosporum DSM 605]
MKEVKASEREELSIVVVGHVDHGKSTLIGRLLNDTGSLPDGAIEKVKKLSEAKGKNFEYAYLLDAFEEEQKQGITIDITRLRFLTEKRDYIIIDAPGHKEFLKNMVTGAASANAAFLLIDANEGIQEQSKRHCYILSLLGIKKVYVLVNKMDLVDYSEERYEKIKEDFNVFLSNLNIYPEEYIPVSAYNGENLTKKSDKMPWYKGLSVIETMDSIEKPAGKEFNPLRLPIQDVYKFDSRRIIAGKIESGSISVGDEVTIYPSAKKTRVKSIEYWVEKDKKDTVYAGESVGITFEDEFFNKRGEIVTKGDIVPTVSNILSANLFWLGKSPLVKNKKYKLKLATQEVECEVIAINKVVDAATLETLKDSQEVKKNDVSEITIKTKEPVAFDDFSTIEEMGRFVIIDDYNISGGGILNPVEDTLKRNFGDIKTQDVAIKKRLVSREEREEVLGQEGKVIWLTGKPGSGKNEIASKLERRLNDLGKKVYYLNSTNLRFGISSDLTFSDEDVHEHVRRIAEIANLFQDAGYITIVTSVSRFKEDRESAKNIIGAKNYYEIYVDANDDICKERSSRPACEAEAAIIGYEKADYPVTSLFIEEVDFDSDKKVDSLIDALNL